MLCGIQGKAEQSLCTSGFLVGPFLVPHGNVASQEPFLAVPMPSMGLQEAPLESGSCPKPPHCSSAIQSCPA